MRDTGQFTVTHKPVPLEMGDLYDTVIYINDQEASSFNVGVNKGGGWDPVNNRPLPVTNATEDIIIMAVNKEKTADPTNPDDPLIPGEVRVDKFASLVPGYVNTWDITLKVKAKDAKKVARPQEIMLVFDNSNSMYEDGGGPLPNKMPKAKKAAKDLVETLFTANENLEMGIVVFGSNSNVYKQKTSNKEELKAAIDAIGKDTGSTGGTWTQKALRQAQEELEKGNSTVPKHIILVSDGQPNMSYRLDIKRNEVDKYFGPLQPVNVYVGKDRMGRVLKKEGIDRSIFHKTLPASGVGHKSLLISEVPIWQDLQLCYHHGHSANVEAEYAKGQGTTIWTVGIDAGKAGNEVLEYLATPGKFFDTSIDNVGEAFQEVAGGIVSAVKDAYVTDLMAEGFDYMDMIQNPSQGSASYSRNERTLSWNLGTLSRVSEDDPSIKEASLKYRVEINDDILRTSPTLPNGKLYYTNKSAKLYYKDSGNHPGEKTFPKPKVDPIFYKITKEVRDEDGNLKSVDESFTINVKDTGQSFSRNVTLDLKDQNTKSTGNFTDLRRVGKYRVEETVFNTDKYNVEYYINGQQNFYGEFWLMPNSAVDMAREDIDIKVVNKEKTSGYDFQINKISFYQPPIGRPITKDLEGAEFTLYEADENYNVVGASIKGYTAGNVISFNKVKPGRYILKETKVPDGYTEAFPYYKVLIRADGTMKVTGPDEVNDGVDNVSGINGVFYIKNLPGHELPYTGGGGVQRLQRMGIPLVALALWGFYLIRKRNHERAI